MTTIVDHVESESIRNNTHDVIETVIQAEYDHKDISENGNNQNSDFTFTLGETTEEVRIVIERLSEEGVFTVSYEIPEQYFDSDEEKNVKNADEEVQTVIERYTGYVTDVLPENSLDNISVQDYTNPYVFIQTYALE